MEATNPINYSLRKLIPYEFLITKKTVFFVKITSCVNIAEKNITQNKIKQIQELAQPA